MPQFLRKIAVISESSPFYNNMSPKLKESFFVLNVVVFNVLEFS